MHTFLDGNNCSKVQEALHECRMYGRLWDPTMRMGVTMKAGRYLRIAEGSYEITRYFTAFSNNAPRTCAPYVITRNDVFNNETTYKFPRKLNSFSLCKVSNDYCYWHDSFPYTLV